MRIGLDARWISRPVGLGILTLNLVRFLAREDSKNQYVLYLSGEKDQALVPKQANFSTRVLTGPYPVSEQVLLPYFIVKDNIDIFHSVLGTSPLLLPKGRLVLTVPDAMFLLPKEVVPGRTNLYQKIGSFYRRLVVPIAYRRAGVVATISQKSKDDLLKVLGTRDQLKVVHLAAAPEFKPGPPKEEVNRKFNLPKSYIFALSAKEPRKNTVALIAGYLKSRVKTPLVLAGTITPEIEKMLNSQIRFIGRVSSNELVSLYRGAKFFVYPSLYEAFGIPLLEAMATGTPVLALATGANLEIGGEAAYLVGPDKLQLGIIRLDRDHPLRERLKSLGTVQAKKFSWEKAASEYLKIYQGVQG
jgi:glycosyltransferase involved in cell wall biosynthesis